ncbi:DUF4435 domain-containing protein [Klebsiella pneumoniae]|nr:DUF4435 domain-containing protein [Klebsiella pneumoniae]MDM9086694.1 DUF4435 domain-containing protein [Klebsiella pneumoniae]
MLINDSNAENFSWSNEAENVISLFYDADIMVYVEGEDDIAFWEIIFKKNGRFNVEVQDVGGCEALQPYIEKNNLRRNKRHSCQRFGSKPFF